MAAGAAALLTEWILEQPGAKGVNSSQIRNIIILGAENLPEMERPNPAVGIWKDGCLSFIGYFTKTIENEGE